MTVKVKRTNLRRLASLSALGAGALGVAASTADAGTPDANGIVYSGIVDEKVGFGAGYGAQATILGPNGAAGLLDKYVIKGSLTIIFEQQIVLVGNRPGPQGTEFRFLGGVNATVSAFRRGAKFGTPAASRSWLHGGVAESETNFSGATSRRTRFNPVDRFFLFKFIGGALTHPVYGWAQLSVSLPGHVGGPNVTLVSYAYDTAGAQIPAGFRGKALDGDEGAYERSGLSALALGAAGVRSWRAARQTQAPGLAGATPAQ
ncbi:MAG: hypothetical protein ABSH32_04090 [Bryobacteraceae bacterium]